MPELPEVRVVVKHLKENVLNKKISDVVIYKEKLFHNFSVNEYINILKDKVILDVSNYGKLITFTLSENYYLYSHLRMEGKYLFNNFVSQNNSKHLIVKFIFSDNSELNYYDSRMFGTFHLWNSNMDKNLKPYRTLGKEPKDITPKELYESFKNSNVAIKTKLLDQTCIAGIGNIYADEILFALKIYPLMPSNKISLEQTAELLKVANKILDDSFNAGGTTIFSFESFNHKKGNYQNYLMIHNPNLKKCKICNNEIKKIKINGRGTYFCPNCQKEKNV